MAELVQGRRDFTDASAQAAQAAAVPLAGAGKMSYTDFLDQCP
ncbi:hypothetical protein GGD68_008779, partial [Paraburkholderia fungorum]|nr:hypothetical protein [Paraburkholderia fungorum]